MGEKMKKFLVFIILLVLIVFSFISLVVLKNNNYLDNDIKEIRKNYQINEINYLNKHDLYYIILTNKNLIVLTNNYQEVLKEDISKIKINKKYDLVYKLNQVMYEEKIVKKDKITYNYYDIYTNELIDSLEIGG